MEDNCPLVSVVLPVYNAEKYLVPCLDSLIHQTYTNFEIIAVDDGSSDSSHSILKDYERKHPKLRVFKNTSNLGLPRTLNLAIEKYSSAPLIARMDADDIAAHDKLFEQVNYLNQNHNVGVLGTNYYFLGKSSAFNFPIVHPEHHDDILSDLKFNRMCHPTVMFKRDAFLSVGGYRSEFINSEDFDLWLRMSRVTKLANLQKFLLFYRLTVSGISTTKRKEMIIYHNLAVESYLHPEFALSKLKQEIMSSRRSKTIDQQVVEQETSQLYFYIKLGWYAEFVRTFMDYLKRSGPFFAIDFSFCVVRKALRRFS